MNRRLFTFGCSFTNYKWQTWADIIGSQFEEFQNWGKSGAGNFFISSSLYECHSIYNITKDDVVLIMFSSIDRFDFINQKSDYETNGSIYGENHSLYGDFVFNKWSEEFGLYNSWFSISSAKQLLDSIGCEYQLMKSFNFNQIDGPREYEKPNNTNQRIDMCLNLIDGMIVGESLNEFHTKKNQHYYFDDLPNKVDGHPPISIHLEWVKQNLKKYYVEEMDSICDNWEKKIPKKINDLLKNNDRGFIDFSVSNKNLDI
jgi:hypothetical protein